MVLSRKPGQTIVNGDRLAEKPRRVAQRSGRCACGNRYYAHTDVVRMNGRYWCDSCAEAFSRDVNGRWVIAESAGQEITELSREEWAILDHTLHRASCGRFCGDSPEMQKLVVAGLMVSLGRASFVPDEFFGITAAGRVAHRTQRPAEG